MPDQQQHRNTSGHGTDTRTVLLKTAEKVFAEKGYNGARVAEIAAKAGVDKRLIFYYFNSKQGLYSQILEEFFREVQPLLEGFLRKSSARTQKVRLKTFLENMTEFICRHRDPVRILFREFLDRGVLLDTLTQEYVRPILELWHTSYQSFFDLAAEEHRESDHMLLSLSGISLFYFLVAPLMEKLWGEDPLSPGHIETRKRIVRRLLGAFDPSYS